MEKSPNMEESQANIMALNSEQTLMKIDVNMGLNFVGFFSMKPLGA